MAVQRCKGDFRRLADDRLKAWAEVPVAITGDSINRQRVMAARIRPLDPAMTITGQAFTVDAFEGDNGAIHAALGIVPEGVVMVINGGGLENRALWGGILNSVALRRKIIGVVIDGAIRDRAELREHGLPIFAVATSPAGPSKGWGGTINGVISCGGVAVSPGDIIRADEDGIAVIPLDREEQAYATAQERLRVEEDALKRMQDGEDTAVIFGAPPIIEID